MKILKAPFKISKKLFKNVKRTFKKIVSSKLGKILMIAVAIYTGGVLMGAWGSSGPLSGIFGAWSGGGAAAAGGAEAGAVVGGAKAGAITTAAPALAPEIATTAGISAGAAPVVEAGVGLAGAGVGTAAPGFFQSAVNLAGTTTESVSAYAAANPALTYMGLKGISAALQPSQADLLREQEAIRRDRFANLANVGDINLRIGQGGGFPTLYDFQKIPWHQRLKRAAGGA